MTETPTEPTEPEPDTPDDTDPTMTDVQGWFLVVEVGILAALALLGAIR